MPVRPTTLQAVALGLLALAAAPLVRAQPAPAIPKIAVLPLVAKRVAPEAVEVLDELLVNGVAKSQRFDVMGAGDINALMGLDRMQQALGCDDLTCAAEIGGALGVQFLLAGTVGKLGDQIVISLRLMDIKRGTNAGRAQLEVADDENRYSGAMAAALAQLLGKAETIGAGEPKATPKPSQAEQPAPGVSAPEQGSLVPVFIVGGATLAAGIASAVSAGVMSSSADDFRQGELDALGTNHRATVVTGVSSLLAAGFLAATVYVLFFDESASEPAGAATPGFMTTASAVVVPAIVPVVVPAAGGALVGLSGRF